MRLHTEILLVVVLTMWPAGIAGKGYCSFPSFVWTPMPDGSRRKWITETTYIQNTDTWEVQKEITARETEMIVRHRYQASCKSKQAESGQCYRKETLYRVICISDEPDNKYRVQHKGDNISLFTCMQFILRKENIIQVLMADPKSINEDRLCYDDSLLRDPWPWISPYQPKWIRCPFEGGYDFRIIVKENKQMCHRVWRPSRLESECMYGEGMAFLFPETSCSPFYNKPLKQEVQCWGYWDEEQYRFLLLNKGEEHPQYILRLPRNMADLEKGEDPIPVSLFLSPIAPMIDTQIDKYSKVIKFYDLKMTKTVSGVCYDESEKCKDFAKQGKCINRALHKYANYCKFSCGLCDYQPSIRQECIFPLEYQGEWMLFDKGSKETLTVTPGEIYISHLGTFICKSKHWEHNHFKLLSTFTNGCRPRFTCIHFSQDTDHSLRYQISRSKMSDESFDMCDFRDDPQPLGDRIRSADMKVLLVKAGIQWGSCGLGGEMRVNATFVGQESCFGTLTDWDMRSCNPKSELSLTLDSCRGRQHTEFFCVGYMNVGGDRSVLITQNEKGDKEYYCWDVETNPSRVYPGSWAHAYMRPSAQCLQTLHSYNNVHRVAPADYRIYVKPYDDRVRQTCRKGEGKVIYDIVPTRRPIVRTTVPTHHIERTPKVTKIAQNRQQDTSKARERKSNTSCIHQVDLLCVVLMGICCILQTRR